MHNFITIKTSRTEIGIGGPTGWYLETTIGRYRIERYRDLDGKVVWLRVDTEQEKRERLAWLRDKVDNDPEHFAIMHVSSDEMVALGSGATDNADAPLHTVHADA